MNDIPVIRIELERAKLTIMRTIGEHMAAMDKEIRTAVETVCTPENVQRILQQQVAATLQGAIKEQVENFFRYGKGRLAIKAAVEAELDPGGNWLPIESAPRNGNTFWGRADGTTRKTWYGKASHVAMHGWCYIPRGGDAEDVTLWEPTEWSPCT